MYVWKQNRQRTDTDTDNNLLEYQTHFDIKLASHRSIALSLSNRHYYSLLYSSVHFATKQKNHTQVVSCWKHILLRVQGYNSPYLFMYPVGTLSLCVWQRYMCMTTKRERERKKEKMISRVHSFISTIHLTSFQQQVFHATDDGLWREWNI